MVVLTHPGVECKRRSLVGAVTKRFSDEGDQRPTGPVYALRLHEAGVIHASPNALLADGTDWRFVNELRRELKA